nr:hypothetical protein [Bifidobacterium subtile]
MLASYAAISEHGTHLWMHLAALLSHMLHQILHIIDPNNFEAPAFIDAEQENPAVILIREA